MESNRPVRAEKKTGFFELEPDWKTYWWGMPEFSQKDARPQYQIVMSFMTWEDAEAFAKKTGLPVTKNTDALWYPHQEKKVGYEWEGPKTGGRYPICIPSKGRWVNQKTGHVLDRMGVPYKFFVEETEGDKYIEALGKKKVVVMPFHDLKRGSIPARNFIWKWAREREYKRHWCLDDNIQSFARCTQNRRVCVRTGAMFQAMEDFVDRYENIAMAGPHDKAFVPDRSPSLTPVLWNSRIYSCILINTSLDYKWRGKYNEDTDLSLRFLKDGYCTALFRALLMDKPGTAGGHMKAMAGGNTDTVYATGDRRLAFAKSLQEQHPDVVKVVWKFGRWHHHVDYSPFAKNKPILIKGITPTAETNDYGMYLTPMKDPE